MKNVFILVAVLFTAVGYGEATTKKNAVAAAPATTATDATTTVSATETTVSAPSDAKLIGDIELRPTWESKTGNFTTENELMLGYQFTKDTSLSYYQYVNSKLYTRGEGEGGLGLSIDDGFVRAKVSNVLRLGETSMGYEFRGVTPTSSNSREKGMITSLQNRFKFSRDFGKMFSLSLQEIPVIPVYSRAGTGTGDKAVANPWIENKVYLVGTINFSDKLSLDLPFLFTMQRLRDFAPTAARNADWKYSFIVWPELTYTIDANLAVGAAFRSADLFKGGAADLVVGDSFEAGATQVFLRALL